MNLTLRACAALPIGVSAWLAAAPPTAGQSGSVPPAGSVPSVGVCPQAGTDPDAAPRPAVGRSLVATRLGIVAASQPLAARAGVQVLEHGGNAIDAAIAANATLGLMEPTGNGMGGDLFALVYEAKTGKVYGLNASGWAATGMTPELCAQRAPDADCRGVAERVTEMPQRGVFAVTVPGAVAGWDALRSRFGRLSFKEILAPAIYYAEQASPERDHRRQLGEVAEAALRLSVGRAHVPRGRDAGARRRRGLQKPRLGGVLRPRRGARARRLLYRAHGRGDRQGDWRGRAAR